MRAGDNKSSFIHTISNVSDTFNAAGNQFVQMKPYKNLYVGFLFSYTGAFITALKSVAYACYYKPKTSEEAVKLGQTVANESAQSFLTPIITVCILGYVGLKIIKTIIGTRKTIKKIKATC